jgi:RHS repeat-associated protein
VERLSYDAWGLRRQTNGEADPSGSIASETSRGFTGHEHLAEVGLIHMNGRVYDPLLGRFGCQTARNFDPAYCLTEECYRRRPGRSRIGLLQWRGCWRPCGRAAPSLRSANTRVAHFCLAPFGCGLGDRSLRRLAPQCLEQPLHDRMLLVTEAIRIDRSEPAHGRERGDLRLDASDPIRRRRPSHGRTSSVTFPMRQCAPSSKLCE